jgi:hypothetical protein
MNERIGKLAEQAGLLGPSSRVGYSHDATEKFAELIVLECVGIVRDGYNSKLRFGDVILNMKTQLGVEE